MDRNIKKDSIIDDVIISRDFTTDESDLILDMLDQLYEANLLIANCIFPPTFSDDEKIDPY